MELLFLGLVFLTIIGLLSLKRPLWQAVTGGLVLTIVLFRIPLTEAGLGIWRTFTNWSSLSVLLTFYLVAFLQKILEVRGQLKLAMKDLNGIFRKRSINAMGSSVFIGLLPSAAAIFLCGDIVREATKEYLDPKEQAFVTSWFRHVPESILPTFTGVLLMLNLSGVEVSGFLLGMVIPGITLILLGYATCLHKIQEDTRVPKSESKWNDVKNLLLHFWTLVLLLVLILVLEMQVVWATVIAIGAALLVYRVRWEEAKPMIPAAFERKLLLNTFLVLVLKEFISYTGVLTHLSQTLERLPLPAYLIFAILFFVVSLISGSTAAIAMGAPLAFAAMPESMPLMVYLMCITHGAMQVSPTHVCVIAAAEYFGVSLGELIRKTIPAVVAFCILMTLYYNLLVLIF